VKAGLGWPERKEAAIATNPHMEQPAEVMKAIRDFMTTDAPAA